jgi:hypothetical protein
MASRWWRSLLFGKSQNAIGLATIGSDSNVAAAECREEDGGEARPSFQRIAAERGVRCQKPDHITRCAPIIGAVAVKFGATGRETSALAASGAVNYASVVETTFDVSLERQNDRRALAEWTRPRFARNLIGPRISAFDDFHQGSIFQ